MQLSQFKHLYFLGIGGIGMSALARYFVRLGKEVAGYDRTETPLTQALTDLGMRIHYTDEVEQIPAHFGADNTLVVLTPAIPADHREWAHLRHNGYTILKRAEVLGLITQDTFCFAVAGTHGKTTTSSILGHLLYQAGVDVTAFVGGIVENYQSNLIGTGTSVTVVEADEFDRSFLKLHPNVACITSMDADHLDIYGDADHIEAGFRAFAALLPAKADLFFPDGLALDGRRLAIGHTADYHAENVQIENEQFAFDLCQNNTVLGRFVFGLPGRHNLMNALTALAMAHNYGVAIADLQRGLASFQGIQRRFSYQIRSAEVVYVDDYAHHPTEIDAVHQALRSLYPDRRICAIFQPHLFSRTRDFMADFARSLGQFDHCWVLPIYPARELPIAGITSEALIAMMPEGKGQWVAKKDWVETAVHDPATVFVTIGAGDISDEVNAFKQLLIKQRL